jgi:CelD/BcsL family acetyltransferase involved in cellulose biosynthesis
MFPATPSPREPSITAVGSDAAVGPTELKLVDSLADLQGLAAEWRKLEAAAPIYIYQSHGFVSTFAEIMQRPLALLPAVVCYREAGQLKGIVPLSIVKKMGVPILTWLGSPRILDHGDLLLDPTASISADRLLAKSLELVKRRFTVALTYLNKVRHDAAARPLIEQKYVALRSYKVPFVSLHDASLDAYLGSLCQNRKNFKADTLRQIKRLSQLGTLRFGVIDRNDDALVARLLEQLYAQKRSKYKRLFFFREPGYSQLFVHQINHLPNAELSCLWLDDKPIGVHFGYVHKDRFTFFLPSYDEAFAKYSPGRVLIYHSIADAFARGLKYFDFGMGDEPYKLEWANVVVEGKSFIGKNPVERVAAWLAKKKLIT